MATYIPFPHKLVLNRFLLSLFGGHAHELDQDTFREVTRRLTDESLELREEDGSSRFCDELSRMLPSSGPLTRILTHLDVSRQDLQRVVELWREFLQQHA